MAHRAEEKARRRAEREEAERQLQAAADRRRRIAFAGGGVLIAAIAVIVGLAVASSGGGDEGPSKSGSGNASIPAPQSTDLNAAAKAAGCTFKRYPDDGNGHATKDFKAADYKTNPPTSGTHFPKWAEDGTYAPDNTPPIGELMHALEHGRVAIQYKAGTPQTTIDQLLTLFNEKVKGQDGYHTLLVQNTTGMSAAVAATAWTRSLTCPSMNDKVFDAIRAFRTQFTDKGLEFVQ